MKRIFSFFVLGGLGVAILGGCPIYSSSSGNSQVCTADACFACSGSSYDPSQCSPWTCGDNSDCPSGYDCTAGSCKATTGTTCASPADCPSGSVCGTDKKCHPGDCTTFGCATGYTCKVAGGKASCEKNGTTPSCDATACATQISGGKCLNGTCVAPADQCTDQTQCVNGKCVNGVCTPECSATKACATGYSCDIAKGVCTGNPNPCGPNNNTCTGGTTCVDNHCVTPCNNGTCSGGLVCVAGGCVPNGKPTFVCNKEGVQDVCATGSLCLHHNCYIACDGSPNSCIAADKFNVCKDVTTTSGSYKVCGSDSNLGSECDVTLGKTCTNAGACIDGFCR